MKPLTRKQRLLFFFRTLFTNPKKIVRLLVLLVCSIVVVFQLAECFLKLRHPPITTHSRFELSETISYPAITFCRDPPYKIEIMDKYNLDYHPSLSSAWMDFPFKTTSIEEPFQTATYNKTEYFGQYGLNKKSHHVKIVSSTHFNLGQCQTMLPQIQTVGSWRSYGYSLTLKHDVNSSNGTPTGDPPGWHLYIHDTKENFTEINMQTSGRVEYMFVNVGEEIEVKLTAQHLRMLPSIDNRCSNDDEHSAVQCEERCYWQWSTEQAKCRGSWMPDVKLPLCNNYEQMRKLISGYRNVSAFDKSICDCNEPCNSIIYSSYIMSRGKFLNQYVPSSQVYLYYTTKMVAIVEERPGYDGSQFLADIGGSLGFLLGLSVLGFIGILEKIAVLILGACIKSKKLTNEADDQQNPQIDEVNIKDRENKF